MKYLKDNWKFLLFILVTGIIGSYFTTLYTISDLDSKLLEEAINQVGSKELVIIITTIQTVIYYVIICGLLGVILSNKVGLWKKISFEKNKVLVTSVISIIIGLSLIFFDLLIFGNFNEIIKQSFEVKPTFDYIISSLFYGGVIEEVMMRLFLMSLFSLIIFKIFYKKESKVPINVFIISNIITAILFAAGHLPNTKVIFGSLDALLLIRCFLLNGGAGLLFGWLYRKYGIQYSMLCHFGAHFVSKIIWLLFI